MENTASMERTFRHGMDVLYLANCALRDVPPQTPLVEAMDFAEVHAMAKKQSMTAIAYYGLEKWLNSGNRQPAEADTELLAKWKQARDMAIRKNTMLDIARDQIFAYFEEHGIWYMPLKGTILKDMYPRLGMRQMADNDILIDAAYRRQVYDFMIRQGYEGSFHEHGAHDEYLKKPFYNFEIHNVLVSQVHMPVFWEYYQNVKDRLLPAGGHRYYFRDEDFYVYLMVHAYKHHSVAGNGIRHIMDIHVFLDRTPGLDWEYIHQELASLGLLGYATAVKNLAQKLFPEDARYPQEIVLALAPDERALLEFSIGAGVYGTLDIRVDNWLQKFTEGKPLTPLRKLQYFWNRLVMKTGLYRDFPRLAKYKILHPFLYIARAVKILLFRRSNLIEEVKAVRKK